MTDRVELRLRGRMGEKFIGRALQDGIHFERIRRTAAREMYLTVSRRDADRLLRMAEELRMDMTVTGEEGRPVWYRRIRERMSLGLGLVLCVVLIVMFCARIWRVEAVSLDGMTDGETLRAVEQFVQEQGIQPGTLRSSVDRDALAMDIQLQWSTLTHVGVRLRGVRLLVEVAAENGAPEVYDVSDSRDLTALRDAVVVYVKPLSGKACVKPGDTVRRGQVLIRGEERIDREVYRSIRAEGEVIARVWFTGECTLPLTQTVRERTGARRISSQLRLGDWSLELSGAEDYPCQDVEAEYLPVGGLYLPVKIVRTVRHEVIEQTFPSDERALKAQGEAWALELARAQMPAGAQENSFWTEYVQNDGMLIVRTTVEAQMNIAADPTEAAQ